jgi:hypothetical protein
MRDSTAKNEVNIEVREGIEEKERHFPCGSFMCLREIKWYPYKIGLVPEMRAKGIETHGTGLLPCISSAVN